MGSTINSMFNESVAAGGSRTAYILRDGGNAWSEVSFSEVARRVEDIGNGLLELGLTRGQRFSILANTRIEWSLCDYAALGSGLVVVPIYQTNSPTECKYVLEDSGSSAVAVEDLSQLAKVEEVRASLPNLKHVILMQGDAPAGSDVLTLADVEKKGREASSKRWKAESENTTSEELATFIYTSGTTGPPKGCMISHGNYSSMIDMCANAGEIFRTDDRIVLFLPLAHSFARLLGFMATKQTVELAYSTVPTLMDDLAEIKPTMLPSVPRVFEKAHTRINGTLNEATGAKAKLVAWAMRTGRLRGRYIEAGRRVPPVLAMQYAVASKLVFSKIQERFGGRLRICISGGAPLSKDIQEFFLAAGIVILEGYGLTETSTATSIARPEAFRMGSVGQALPGAEIKVAEDGELLVRGPHIFQGYHGNEEATREVKTADGWFHTGDIGVIDKQGFVYITDRKKDLIVTAGGKNISPQNIEGSLKATQYISQAVVYGDRKPYLAALLTLDADEMQTFASTHGLPTDMTKLIDTDEVKKLVEDAVKSVNSKVNRVEQVKRFRILPIDFSQETGELTPSLKLKRKAVCERYRDYIEQMYEADAPDVAAITDPKIKALQTV